MIVGVPCLRGCQCFTLLCIEVFEEYVFLENWKLTIFVCSQHTDMPDEMRIETMELCVSACETFATNNEVTYSGGSI